MVNSTKTTFIQKLEQRYGKLHKFDRSLSLYELQKGATRIYIRYSKVHARGRTFYGLRKEDLQKLEGYPSIICFIWEGQDDPLCVPFSDYEDVFHSVAPAGDGQYKVQVFIQDDGNEFYIANAGRFNVEGYMGWGPIDALIDKSDIPRIPELSHSQVQTLLGSIGKLKGYEIWVPPSDRRRLDWAITDRFDLHSVLPPYCDRISDIISEIDVLWFQRGAGKLRALFEVEHSTGIYPGLLRFNDVLLTLEKHRPAFRIVSNDKRRSLFVRQLGRPTFRSSGLGEYCSFLEYDNVYSWHKRLIVS